MTAELEAEQARRVREHQLAEAQRVAKLGSFEWALTSGQVTWSAELCRILGLDPEACRGTIDGLLQRVHPDDRPEAAETLRRAATDGTSFRMQARILRPSGEERVLSGWGDVTRDEQGRPSRMLGICQDVTDWYQREEQLIDAQAQAELSRRLQSGLLPSLSLPDPALELRTRYRPGHERALLGADFFDALPLADGTVALLIGDVAGHGAAEAAVGVALRAAWRALVLTDHEADDLLDGLDKVLVSNRQSEEVFATVCCCWVGPGHDRITVALAGHPPPLLARAGRVEVVEVPGGPALGILDQPYPWEAGVLEVSDGLDPAVLHRRAGRGPQRARRGGAVRDRGPGRAGHRAAGGRRRARRHARPAARRRPRGQRRRPVGRRRHPLPVPGHGRSPGPGAPPGCLTRRPAPCGGRSPPGSRSPAARPASPPPAASSRPGPRPGRSRSGPASSSS